MAEEPLTIVKYFNHEAGFFSTLKYGIGLLCGQKEIGVTDNGDLVQTGLTGNPKKIGERLLGLYDPDPEKSIKRTYNQGYNTPEDRRDLIRLNPTDESLRRIDTIIEDSSMRQKIKERLKKYAPHDLRFGGELCQLDVYKFEDPQKHNDAKYMIVENTAALMWGGICVRNNRVTAYTPKGKIVQNVESELGLNHKDMERKYKVLSL